MQSSRWIEKKDDFYTYLKHFNTLTISWEDFIGGFLTNQSREIWLKKVMLDTKSNVESSLRK